MNDAITMTIVSAGLASLALAGGAHASIGIQLLGSDAPPTALLGPSGALHPVLAAIDDTSPLDTDVGSAPLALPTRPDGLAKYVDFSIPLHHLQIGDGWATWSHGYTGDVYYSNGALSIALSFNQIDQTAFAFYVESNPFDAFTASVTAIGSFGTSVTVSQAGLGDSGACGFGVVAEAGEGIATIIINNVSTTTAVDFAVGEFSWGKDNIPAPGALALLGVAGLCGRRRRA